MDQEMGCRTVVSRIASGGCGMDHLFQDGNTGRSDLTIDMGIARIFQVGQ
jgi:hypothetical protein